MSSLGRATVDRKGYGAYIRSDAWAAVRARYWRSKLPKVCVFCGASDRPLDLHHRTYKNLGREFLRDLIPVCRDCHTRIHVLQKQTGRHVYVATQATKRAVAKEGSAKRREAERKIYGRKLTRRERRGELPLPPKCAPSNRTNKVQ